MRSWKNIVHVYQLIYIYNDLYISSRRKNGWLPPKQGKDKLTLFYGSGEQVIPIYAGPVDYSVVQISSDTSNI